MWIVVYIQAPFSQWLDKKFDKGILRIIPIVVGVPSIRSFWWTAVLLLTLYFYMFIGMHSKNKAQSIVELKQGLVLVHSEATSGTVHEYSLLGTTINYVFLYNHQTKRTLILPLESINSIEPRSIPKKASVPVPVKSE